MEANNGVGELRHDRLSCGCDRKDLNLIHTYAFNPRPGAKPTGRFASNPMRKLESAEIAAVVVMRSLRTSSTQARYVVSELQPSLVGHSQVPPVSERMDALTDILSTSAYGAGQ